MRIVYANVTTTVSMNPGFVALTKGEPWDASDPVVAAHPKCFSDDPTRVKTTKGQGWVDVEQMTAAPGEKRRTKR